MKVDVYRLDLNEPPLDLQSDWLDEKERERSGRLVQDWLREKYVLSHAFLRKVLSRYLSMDPASISYCYSDQGKPFLKNHPVYFNLSHSGDVALVAVCKEAPVGVDVEEKKLLRDFLSISKRFFSEAEHQALLSCPEAERQDAFYFLWTCKEAYLKMLGLGVGFGLERFTVGLDAGFDCLLQTEVKTEIGRDCWLGAIKMRGNYTAALATSKKSSLLVDYFDF